MATIPFQLINWANINKEDHTGETGKAFWQTILFDDLRVRVVEYTAGYIADHWCQKGHIVYCLEGSFITELNNGDKFELTAGQSYIVSDNLSSHKSISTHGVKLFIVDGGFLK